MLVNLHLLPVSQSKGCETAKQMLLASFTVRVMFETQSTDTDS